MAKAYSNDLRLRCVEAMLGGEPASKVAERFGVAKSSVIKWHQRYRATGSVSPGKMGGHRKFVLRRKTAVDLRPSLIFFGIR